MYCPVCKGEFREGFTECAGCQVNLVEDLNDITEAVTGEFLLCRACEREFHEKLSNCPGCGLKLIRAVLHDDTYVFLEESVMEYASEDQPGGFDHHDCCVEIDDAEGAVLLESEDMAMMAKIQDILNDARINFFFKPAEDNKSTLGSVFGASNPMSRSFPRVIVRAEDEERALNLIANHPELGLFDIPAELMESEDDDEDDYEDDDQEQDS